ncbi:MAG TPA: hypothetical protein VGI39_12195 [Polyangiaceae bacterium]
MARRGWGTASVARRAPPIAAIGFVTALSASILPGCESTFEGPYPCKSGFASCTTPDACETSIDWDGANCGACGRACATGAACASGVCGPAPMVLASTGSGAGLNGGPVTVASNGTAVIWSTNQGEIETVPVSGGSPTTLFSCNGGQGGCNASGQALAIDSSAVYFSFQNNQAPGSPVEGIYSLPIAGGGTPSPIATFSTTSNVISWIGVERGSVYFVESNGGGSSGQLLSVPLSGGSPSPIGVVGSGSNQLALGPSGVYFISCNNNGPCALQGIPLAGGSPLSFPSPSNGGGGQAVATDASSVYVLNANVCCSCSGSESNNNTSVVKYPAAGGPPELVLQTTLTLESVQAAVVDSSSVYWVTYSAAWKAPLSGGEASPIAGNLTGGQVLPSSSPCNGGSGIGTSNAIALDATNVYIADGFTSTIYRFPK